MSSSAGRRCGWLAGLLVFCWRINPRFHAWLVRGGPCSPFFRSFKPPARKTDCTFQEASQHKEGRDAGTRTYFAHGHESGTHKGRSVLRVSLEQSLLQRYGLHSYDVAQGLAHSIGTCMISSSHPSSTSSPTAQAPPNSRPTSDFPMPESSDHKRHKQRRLVSVLLSIGNCSVCTRVAHCHGIQTHLLPLSARCSCGGLHHVSNSCAAFFLRRGKTYAGGSSSSGHNRQREGRR